MNEVPAGVEFNRRYGRAGAGNINEENREGWRGDGDWAGTHCGAEQDGRQERGEHHEKDNRGEESFVHNPDSPANSGKDEADFAARHHAKPDSEPVHSRGTAQTGGHLANDGDEGQRQTGDEHVLAGHGFQLDLNPHPHKEERHDQRFDGREQFLKRSSFHFPVEETVQDHARGEGTDDGGEFRDIGEPGEEKSKLTPKSSFKLWTPKSARLRTSFGVSQIPTPRETTRKRAALPVMMAMEAKLMEPVTARPLTTARTIRQRTRR